MSEVFEAMQMTDHVWWVGAVDWDIRDFHGYATTRGTSYNAYLVLGPDGQAVLIDTVKKPFRQQMLSRIRSVVDPARIGAIISNHSEMDHTGCLPEMIELARPSKVYASKMGCKAIKAHFGLTEIEEVKDGQSLALGGLTYTFHTTPMLHWPDSMFSYLHEDRVLFSNDAFGMHLASSERYADELPWEIIEQETAKYYANILLPMSALVQKLLAKAAEWKLPIDLLATDHGPIWRKDKDIDRIFALYARWAAQAPTDKAVILYDTMWQSTDLMAQAVAEGVLAGGATARLMPMRGSHRSDVATELLEAGALIVGSPTLNNNIFPSLADVLVYLKGLKRANLVGGAFGSYGWSGEAVGQLNDWLDAMGVQRVGEAVKCVYVPEEDALAACRKLGEAVAARLTAASR